MSTSWTKDETIIKLWFADERLFILTSNEKKLSVPLEAFPQLKEADIFQRSNYEIGRFGDDIRWDEIDVDIHISSFYEDLEPHYDNEVAALFNRFPQLNVSEVARSIGIHKSLLSQYIYGVKKPGPNRMKAIKDTLRKLGEDLIEATTDNNTPDRAA